jgi:hypothetical protein
MIKVAADTFAKSKKCANPFKFYFIYNIKWLNKYEKGLTQKIE